MTDNMSNFVRWFKKPLEQLYTNTDPGLIVLMASLPLFEHYLRQKTGVHETHSLTDGFYKEFLQIFPSVGNIDNAKKV
jgi:DNA gyrase inhibitor GyrI